MNMIGFLLMAIQPAPLLAPQNLSCSVSGLEVLETGITERELCERVAGYLSDELAVAVTLDPKRADPKPRSGNWIAVDIQIKKLGALVAHVKKSQAKGVKEFPEISVSVMDRKPNLEDIHDLVGEISRNILEK
jgi:hypothetical protein